MNHFLRSLSILTLLSMFAFSTIFGQKPQPDTHTYKVVINHEEQYAIVFNKEKNRPGWKDTGTHGSFLTCEEYLNAVWTDMRPLSIQKLNLPDDTRYQVVINHEEQYSIWPSSRQPAKGWKAAGKQGNLKACMSYIAEVWTDMRPLSVRKKAAK